MGINDVSETQLDQMKQEAEWAVTSGIRLITISAETLLALVATVRELDKVQDLLDDARSEAAHYKAYADRLDDAY